MMDRQSAAEKRYEGLKKTLADEPHLRKRGRLVRILGLIFVGAWAVIPAIMMKVDYGTIPLPEFFRVPTAHEAYLLEVVGVEGEAVELGRRWEAASYRAIDSPLQQGRAYQEIGLFPGDNPQALGLRVHIPEGQRLFVDLAGEGDEGPGVFLDIFRPGPESTRPAPVESSAWDGEGWHFDPPEPGDYVLRVQPKLGSWSRYQLRVRVGAPWVFPVANGGRDDIGGVFGDPRDGGSRRHHGVDIFKPRGTPALAAAAGVVSSVDTTDIGGRVVWLREAGGRHSIYYAHLERPLVREGQRVQAGDTVGLVGNTGNARTTPPHLHFGAYRRGPQDPWNLILPQPPAFSRIWVPLDDLGTQAEVRTLGADLKRSPSDRGTTLVELNRGDPILVLAGTGGWFRVIGPEGQAGYVEGGSVRFQ